MARKGALIKIKDGISPLRKEHLKNIKRLTPVEGTQETYDNYTERVERTFRQEFRFDQVCDMVDKDPKNEEIRALYKVEGKKLTVAIDAEFGALDKWRHNCRHLNDKVAVPEDEVRNVVIASVSEKIESIGFSMNAGLLGSKVAQAIRNDVSEDDTLEAPLCQEHAI